LGALNVAASLKELESGHHVTGQVIKRRPVPVSGRVAYTTFVVTQDSYAVADQKTCEGQKVVTILRSGRVNENDSGVGSGTDRTSQRANKLDVSIGKPYFFTPLRIYSSTEALYGVASGPS
jgi:hypothetical protein